MQKLRNTKFLGEVQFYNEKNWPLNLVFLQKFELIYEEIGILSHVLTQFAAKLETRSNLNPNTDTASIRGHAFTAKASSAHELQKYVMFLMRQADWR